MAVHYETVVMFLPKVMMLNLQSVFIVSIIPSDLVKKERVQMKYQEVVGRTGCCWCPSALTAQKAVCKLVAGPSCPSVCPGLLRSPFCRGSKKN